MYRVTLLKCTVSRDFKININYPSYEPIRITLLGINARLQGVVIWSYHELRLYCILEMRITCHQYQERLVVSPTKAATSRVQIFLRLWLSSRWAWLQPVIYFSEPSVSRLAKGTELTGCQARKRERQYGSYDTMIDSVRYRFSPFPGPNLYHMDHMSEIIDSIRYRFMPL